MYLGVGVQFEKYNQYGGLGAACGGCTCRTGCRDGVARGAVAAHTAIATRGVHPPPCARRVQASSALSRTLHKSLFVWNWDMLNHLLYHRVNLTP